MKPAGGDIISELKRLNEARNKEGLTDKNRDQYITLLAYSCTALLAVVAAAEDMTNLYAKMQEMDAELFSPRTFWALLQDYCNEYGALKRRLAALRGDAAHGPG